MCVKHRCPISDFRFCGPHRGKKALCVSFDIHQILPFLPIETVDGKIIAENGKIVAFHHVQFYGVESNGFTELENDFVGRFRVVFQIACPVAFDVARLAVTGQFRTMILSPGIRFEETAAGDFDRMQDLDGMDGVQQQGCHQKNECLLHLSPRIGVVPVFECVQNVLSGIGGISPSSPHPGIDAGDRNLRFFHGFH